jgi:hypothetical protein
MTEYFRGTDIFTNMGYPYPFGPQKSEPINEVNITDADLSLLYALKEAYASGGPGQWEVKKSRSDTREWMPDVIYGVVRDDVGRVTTYRVANDFRIKSERNSPLRVGKRGNIYDREPHPFDAMLHENMLCRKRTFSSTKLFSALWIQRVY